jgi:hypothetical protein
VINTCPPAHQQVNATHTMCEGGVRERGETFGDDVELQKVDRTEQNGVAGQGARKHAPCRRVGKVLWWGHRISPHHNSHGHKNREPHLHCETFQIGTTNLFSEKTGLLLLYQDVVRCWHQVELASDRSASNGVMVLGARYFSASSPSQSEHRSHVHHSFRHLLGCSNVQPGM